MERTTYVCDECSVEQAQLTNTFPMFQPVGWDRVHVELDCSGTSTITDVILLCPKCIIKLKAAFMSFCTHYFKATPKNIDIPWAVF